jgi:hypothetical protein
MQKGQIFCCAILTSIGEFGRFQFQLHSEDGHSGHACTAVAGQLSSETKSKKTRREEVFWKRVDGTKVD